MLDTYNQQVQPDVACTIRTNINTANHHFVVMETIAPYNSDGDCSRTIKAQYQQSSNANFIRQDGLGAAGVINTTNYRIRKLTPRECFRLMGVDDADIDKIQASGLSNARQYQCAGNSIVVDVLYHIFRQAFCEEKPKARYIQQTLF